MANDALYERSLADRHAAGCFLFMIRARARFSDKMNVSHLVVDAHEEFGNRFGCLVAVQRHLTRWKGVFDFMSFNVSPHGCFQK